MLGAIINFTVNIMIKKSIIISMLIYSFSWQAQAMNCLSLSISSSHLMDKTKINEAKEFCQNHSGRLVIVVDDQKINRLSLIYALSLLGYGILTFEDGQDFIQAMDLIGNMASYSLAVILDNKMKIMYGEDVIKELYRKELLASKINDELDGKKYILMFNTDDNLDKIKLGLGSLADKIYILPKKNNMAKISEILLAIQNK